MPIFVDRVLFAGK